MSYLDRYLVYKRRQYITSSFQWDNILSEGARTTDAQRGNSLHCTARPKFTHIHKFLDTAEAYFVCHIGPIFQVSLIYAFIGCPCEGACLLYKVWPIKICRKNKLSLWLYYGFLANSYVIWQFIFTTNFYGFLDSIYCSCCIKLLSNRICI